ncbi:MAG: Tol-Pal system beta propeller repeat protein TolB [Deltaproteobacteria bacterium]|nr:MAG: Tol-Pal system beta propeller repeat protein TolB [Deltaproteobacteria bacterium]
MRTLFNSFTTRSFSLVLTGLLLCFCWVLPALGAQYDYVDINNPALRKIPTAIPFFKPVNQTGAEKVICSKAADMLADMLVFTGYFKMLDRGSFLIEPYSPNIVARQIKFKNWTGIGAELLVTGGVVLEGGALNMELRLFDTFKGQLLVGKRYRGREDDLRRMIRRFSSEIIFVLTGNRGIFDSKITFVSTVSGHKEIFTCDFDGKDPVRITHNNSINLSPAWSSDGQWIAYTSYAKNKPDLYIRQIKKKTGAVVSKKGLNIAPSWVPGKLQLAATLSFSGDPEIYLLTQTGKIIKRLTHSSGIDVSVSWSPDGKKMAFVSRRAGSPQIYIKEIASGQVRRLTFEGKNNTQPAWSPNGDRIAYTAMNRDGLNIRVIGIDGRGLAQMTHNSGDNESPSWSPDGSLIVFSSDREGTSRIYIMNAYGTDQRRLLKLPGQQSEPDWSGNMTAP